MTIIEALRISKGTGDLFSRPGSTCFFNWKAGYTYRFTAEELIADDWEDVKTLIPRLTSGHYGAAE